MKFKRFIEKAYDHERLNNEHLGGNWEAYEAGAAMILKAFLDLKLEDEYVEESNIHEQRIFEFSNGEKLVMHKDVCSTVDFIRGKEPLQIIELMKLYSGDMEDYILNQKKLRVESAIELFKLKWEFPATGEPADFNEDFCEYVFGIKKSVKQIIALLKKNKINDSQVKSIINYFENSGDVRQKI